MPLIAGAMRHHGSAFIDVISPCVAFNNHLGSTKSFDYVREHNESVNRLDIIEARAPITADYAPGTVETITQHDGSMLRFRKLHADYDPQDRIAAMTYLQQRHAAGEIVTGLVMMLIGQNGRQVVNRVKDDIEQLKKSLPPGVTIEVIRRDDTGLAPDVAKRVATELIVFGGM